MNDITERRDQVIEHLSTDFARGALEVDELENRLALAHDAKSSAELDALVTDLALVPTSTALVPARNLRVAFSSVERVGPWAVPQNLSARVVFGSLVLDLREARLAPGQTTIEVHVTMGNIEVIVPPGIAVDVDATSFLGQIEARADPSSRSAASSVRVVGRVKLGNFEVSTRLPGETERDARRRRRHERRWSHAMRHRRAAPTPWWD